MKSRQHTGGEAHAGESPTLGGCGAPTGRRQSPSAGRDGHGPGALVAGLLLGCSAGLASAGYAQGDAAFSPESARWDGLAALAQIASESSITIETPSEVDLGALEPSRDALLVVHPTVELPSAGLSDFLTRGGRVAIADDFGRSDAFLASYHFERRLPSVEGLPSLRRNPGLPVARALYDHPLTSGVQSVVANHPSVSRHPELAALIAFDDSGDALLSTGAIGDGRLVVLSDPSVLINNMLELQGNRRFAENLLAYLDGGRGGRLFLAVGDTPIVGRHGDRADASGFERLEDWLGDLAAAELPPDAIRALYVTLALLILFFAVATVPRRSPYRAELMLPDASRATDPSEPVGLFARRGANLLHPALVYAEELRAALRAALGLPADAGASALVAGLRARGLPADVPAAAEQLLQRFAELERAAGEVSRAPKIGRGELRRMVDTGQRLLAALHGPLEKR